MKKKPDFRKRGIVAKFLPLVLLFLFYGFSNTVVYGQQVTVTGTVISASDKMPLPGVSIVDTNNPAVGVVTDFDGNYQLTVTDANTSLRYSYIGFKALVVPVAGKSVLNVDMEEDVRSEEHTSELQSRENLVCRLL